MAVTIRDVANAAGVSIATVSRALRGHTSISQRTRDHVTAVAASLDYQLPARQPNPANSEPHLKVAVVAPFIGRWYFARMLEGIERITRERGYEAVVFRPMDSVGEALPIAEHLDHFGIQGAIILSIQVAAPEFEALVKRKMPIVLVDIQEPRFTFVGIDNVAVGRTATEHLLSLGHRRIAMVTGDPNDPMHFDTPNDRRRGYLQAMKAAGVAVDPELEVHADFTARGADAAVRRILAGERPPTAIFAASDEMAVGVIGAAKHLGLRVPEDLSVIGVDDHDIAESLGLTTIAQPIESLAEIAAWQLISRLNGSASQPPARFVMPTELVVRESTAALAGHR